MAICFYDRRHDPRNFLIGRTCAIKSGKALSEIPIATDGWPSVVGQDLSINRTYMGDYDVTASDFTNSTRGFVGAFQFMNTGGGGSGNSNNSGGSDNSIPVPNPDVFAVRLK